MLHNPLKLYHKIVRKAIENILFQKSLASFSELKVYFRPVQLIEALNELKGITVKVDAELHAKVKEYIESHGITMAEFVSQALDNELRPREVQGMRTIAFQVPEELFDEIKDYLTRHNMTQKEFMLGLINAELERDQQTMSEKQEEDFSENYSEDEDMTMNMG